MIDDKPLITIQEIYKWLADNWDELEENISVEISAVIQGLDKPIND